MTDSTESPSICEESLEPPPNAAGETSTETRLPFATFARDKALCSVSQAAKSLRSLVSAVVPDEMKHSALALSVGPTISEEETLQAKPREALLSGEGLKTDATQRSFVSEHQLASPPVTPPPRERTLVGLSKNKLPASGLFLLEEWRDFVLN